MACYCKATTRPQRLKTYILTSFQNEGKNLELDNLLHTGVHKVDGKLILIDIAALCVDCSVIPLYHYLI